MAIQTIRELVDDAIKYLNDRLEEKEKYDYVGDIIHEVADSYVPIYTHDLIKIASSSIDLVVNEPDC